MKLSMWNIYHELTYSDIIPLIIDGTCTITGIRWLISTQLNGDRVYIGSARDYFEAGEDDALIVHRRDMILVKQISPEEVFDEVCSIIERFNIWDQRLCDLIESPMGLQRMIDISKDVLNNASYIYSPLGEILAIASDYPSSVHWHWKELIDNNGLSEKRLKYLKDNIHLSAVFEDSVPVKRKSVMDDYEYIHCSLFYQNRIVGHFVLFGFTNPIPEGMEDLVGQLVFRMNQYVGRHSVDFSPQSKLNKVFLEYLEKENVEEDTLKSLLSSFHWQVRGAYQVIVLKEMVSNEPVLLSRTCQKLTREIPRILAVIYKERIVILRNLNDTKFAAMQDDRLSAIMENDFCAGFSNPFIEFECAELYYRQALAEVGRCEVSGFQSSYGKDHIMNCFGDMIKSDNLLLSYVEPVLIRLKDHDTRHDTAYYETFRAYCITGFHKAETAVYLNLHRNSLNYRLDKINELLGEELFLKLTRIDKPKQREQLILSCLILDSVQKNNNQFHNKQADEG